MNINKLDTIEQIFIHQVPGLADFLSVRPDEEDLGESLDLYKKRLSELSQLNDDIDKTIRGLHLKHQSIIFINNPICCVDSKQLYDTSVLKEFCSRLNNVLFDYSPEAIDELMVLYNDTSNRYITMEVIDYFLKLKDFERAYSIFHKQIDSIFIFSAKNWNSKENSYGAAMLASRMVSYFVNYDWQNTQMNIIVGRIIEITYLLLTRVICWPEEPELAKRSTIDLPISYEHRIGALLKRIELLDHFRSYLMNLIPSLSTVDTLIVSDYYFAHELSFALETLGKKSEFKRDARDKYRTLDTSKIRPFSTCITDGKKDGLELAYRFFIKYSGEKYVLDTQQKSLLDSYFEKNFYVVSDEREFKADKELILDFFRQNNIDCFYHFTEKANLPNIRLSGGLYSQRECLAHSIIPKTSGEMRHLREKDSGFYLEDYVRLSFCKKHPLTKERKGELVLLKVKIDIALLDTTLFSDRDAALDSHQRGNRYEDLKKIHLNAIRDTYMSKDDPEYDFSQAEIMVKSYVPREYIINLDNPDII